MHEQIVDLITQPLIARRKGSGIKHARHDHLHVLVRRDDLIVGDGHLVMPGGDIRADAKRGHSDILHNHGIEPVFVTL